MNNKSQPPNHSGSGSDTPIDTIVEHLLKITPGTDTPLAKKMIQEWDRIGSNVEKVKKEIDDGARPKENQFHL